MVFSVGLFERLLSSACYGHAWAFVCAIQRPLNGFGPSPMKMHVVSRVASKFVCGILGTLDARIVKAATYKCECMI